MYNTDIIIDTKDISEETIFIIDNFSVFDDVYKFEQWSMPLDYPLAIRFQ